MELMGKKIELVGGKGFASFAFLVFLAVAVVPSVSRGTAIVKPSLGLMI